MGFPEKLKTEVRRRAHLACCICHDVGVEIHHIVPQSDGGSDDEDNAAPLCPSCHERYGANPTKRKLIRQARDLWFELCAERFASDRNGLERIHAALDGVATKKDIEGVLAAMNNLASPAAERSELADLPWGLTGRPITGDSVRTYMRWLYGDIAHCGPEYCARIVRDLNHLGYSDIGELHAVVGDTRGPFADFASEQRGRGMNLDQHTDHYFLKLFLALFDEGYCAIHYPGSSAQRAGADDEYVWRRPLSGR